MNPSSIRYHTKIYKETEKLAMLMMQIKRDIGFYPLLVP